uniref:Uncharacterized protein n=1 Tax=Rhizophora mucronata TaxID=61149 RepID=A0A2P2Q8P4_RHIMU
MCHLSYHSYSSLQHKKFVLPDTNGHNQEILQHNS